MINNIQNDLPFVDEFPEEPFFRTFPAAGLLTGRMVLPEETKFGALFGVLNEILLLETEWFPAELPVWKLTTILFVSDGCVEL